jgi:uncharacterized metal-binding protein YceD (DUF177 family)
LSRKETYRDSQRVPVAPVLDASIRMENLPAVGREIVVSATDEQKAAIAEQLKITAVEKLDAKLEAKRFRGGIQVLGRLEAVIEQPCVVSFEPVKQVIDEPIDRVFLPSHDKAHAAPAGAEIFVDVAGDDEPDRFDGPEVDLSDLIIETLALAVDPYPRAPGASIDAVLKDDDDDDGEVSPFSRLKALKSPEDGN